MSVNGWGAGASVARGGVFASDFVRAKCVCVVFLFFFVCSHAILVVWIFFCIDGTNALALKKEKESKADAPAMSQESDANEEILSTPKTTQSRRKKGASVKNGKSGAVAVRHSQRLHKKQTKSKVKK